MRIEDRMRSNLALMEEHDTPYDVDVCGRAFTVLPRVFSPKYCTDTAFFAATLPIREGGHPRDRMRHGRCTHHSAPKRIF